MPIVKKIAKSAYTAFIFCGAILFWGLISFMLVYNIYISCADNVYKKIPLSNGFAFVSSSVMGDRIISRKGHEKVGHVKYFCEKDNYIYGEKDIYPAQHEHFFIINSKSGDVFLTVEYDSYENSLKEFGKYLGEYGLEECNAGSIVWEKPHL